MTKFIIILNMVVQVGGFTENLLDKSYPEDDKL